MRSKTAIVTTAPRSIRGRSPSVAWAALAALGFAFFPSGAEPADVSPGATRSTRPAASGRTFLFDGERNTIDVFKRVSPSVVSVANKALVSGLFGPQVYEVPQGIGSGFIWDREGHIVSNFHVIQNASSIEVVMKDGTSYEATVVGADADNDVAVLKIKAPYEKLIPIPAGRSADLQVGQAVLAIGNPFGFDCSLSVGVVSSLGRSMKSITGITIHDMIQTDAAINSGNSGGPLLDSGGRLIGICTAIVTPSGGSVGLGFAIPADTVASSVQQLIAKGRVERAGLGIELFPDYVAHRYNIEGVVVRTVPLGSAAARAGLRGTRNDEVGDILVQVDGKPVTSVLELRDALHTKKKGDIVDVIYRRNGKDFKTKVTLQSVE